MSKPYKKDTRITPDGGIQTTHTGVMMGFDANGRRRSIPEMLTDLPELSPGFLRVGVSHVTAPNGQSCSVIVTDRSN